MRFSLALARERDHLIFWPLKPTENVQLEKVILPWPAKAAVCGKQQPWPSAMHNGVQLLVCGPL